MTQSPLPGYPLEMRLWAVELVVFIVFAVRCIPRFGRGQFWGAIQLAIICLAFLLPWYVACLRLEQLYEPRALPAKVHEVMSELRHIHDLHIAAAAIFTVMLLMHSISWLTGKCLRHKPTISDNLNPIPQ